MHDSIRFPALFFSPRQPYIYLINLFAVVNIHLVLFGVVLRVFASDPEGYEFIFLVRTLIIHPPLLFLTMEMHYGGCCN